MSDNEHMDIIDNYEEARSLAFGPTVLEQVLLRIIKSNPTNGAIRDGERLKQAMKALINEKPIGHLFNNPIDKSLRHMAQEYHKDKCLKEIELFSNRNNRHSTPVKIRSFAQLAREAVEKIMPNDNDELKNSTAKRLEEMFSGRYQKKGGKNTGVDYLKTYLYRANEHDYVGETLEAEAVNRICDELAEWGVSTKRSQPEK